MPAWFVLSQVPVTTGPGPAGPAAPAVPAAGGAATPVTTATGSVTTATSQPKADNSFFGPGLIFPILIIVMLYLFMVRPKGKEAKQQEAMLKALKRGDRVLTIGGLIGSVIEVRGDEVVLKVDESNNVKERYIRSAIKSILVDGEKAEESKK